jgi:hypothetical protein
MTEESTYELIEELALKKGNLPVLFKPYKPHVSIAATAQIIGINLVIFFSKKIINIGIIITIGNIDVLIKYKIKIITPINSYLYL